MNIEHISVSRKGVWDTCQAQYKYQYHLKVQTDEPEPIYFTFGKMLHKIAEEYVKSNGELLLEEVSRDVVNGKIPIDSRDGELIYAPKLLPENKKRMDGMLRAIRKLTRKLGTEGMVEHQFRYDLDPPNDKNVTGLIDRLIQREDKWIIVDYKTTKRGPWRLTPSTVTKDIQLRCYARVVQKQFNVPADKIFASLYYLEGGNLIGAQFSQKSLEQAEQELLNAYLEIEKTPPENAWGNVGDHCKRCKFRKMCPFVRLT
jgi:CRISPR/Cas system-associated exonuclease Cas4 (RecB family)